ncbi:MAG: arsenate reductase ArsC, partial [Chloroflexaceae bacterium]|nr:arsenate reductase ArsC [Chloroflexaceae bacterium]
RVLFLCTHNSARSQIAEGLLRHHGQADFLVASAGTDPQGIHPLAIQVMDEAGIDIRDQQSTPLQVYLDHTFDFIITVCDRANDTCPTFPGDPERIHWGFPDPSQVEDRLDDRIRAFRKVRIEMQMRIQGFILVQRKQLYEQGILTRPGAEAFRSSSATLPNAGEP